MKSNNPMGRPKGIEEPARLDKIKDRTEGVLLEKTFRGFDGDAIEDAKDAILNMARGNPGGGLAQLGAAKTILEMQCYKEAWRDVELMTKEDVMRLLSYIASTGTGNRQMMGAIDRLIDLNNWQLGNHALLEEMVVDPAEALAQMIDTRKRVIEHKARVAEERAEAASRQALLFSEPESVQ